MILDDRDLAILGILQRDAKLSAKKISDAIDCPVTTVYSRIKKLEEMNVIKGYTTSLNHEMLGWTTTAFVFASIRYEHDDSDTTIGSREIANEISKFEEVQEVHIISGNWDLLVKLKAKDVSSVGEFVIDKIRELRGVQKTLTSMVFETLKNTDYIPI